MTQPTNLSLLNQRRVGVLLHISSLPSPYYVGDLGTEAKRVVDLLHTMGVTIWQTLPINMPHADNSPYQCLSAHAGNPDFISLEALQIQGLLTQDDVDTFIASESFNKSQLYAKAYQVFTQQIGIPPAFVEFCSQQAHWLNDFALFLALRTKFNNTGWDQWPEAYKNRDATTLQNAHTELAEEIAIIQFTQFMFFSQWHSLKEYAASKNVYLFGDIPIFVAYDSAEVWAQPHLFKLDENKNMSVVAGVPPDYFCATGQRWGNPHYNWEAMATDGYAWWVSRMTTQSALFDMVRIDHFRGLEAAWEVSATEETAMNGQWALAPGDELLAAITQALPGVTLIAEDLGIITPEVDALRMKYNLPGMKILQFAFSGQDDNPYLPHNIDVNSVVYTGTHDNDTTVGWYQAMDDLQREHVHAYLNASHTEAHEVKMPNDLINMALESDAQLAIIPMQDLMALDTSHRMNTPGTCTGNWHWRFTWEQLAEQLTGEQQASFAETVARTGRA
jgi:4-alpha-glucanotransferase